jgi:hypothetical protein
MLNNPIIRRATLLDIEAVNGVVKHPDVYGPDDYEGRGPAEEMKTEGLLICPPPFHVLIDDTNSFVSIFMPENSVMWVGHLCSLPEIRGKTTVSIAKAMIQWMFKNTPCMKIVGYTPVTNRRAVAFTRMMGMVKEGLLKKAHMLNGELGDIYVSGICKE